MLNFSEKQESDKLIHYFIKDTVTERLIGFIRLRKGTNEVDVIFNNAVSLTMGELEELRTFVKFADVLHNKGG